MTIKKSNVTTLEKETMVYNFAMRKIILSDIFLMRVFIT